MDKLIAVWITLCTLFVLFIWGMVYMALRQRRKFLYVRVLGNKGMGLAGVKLYGYRYAHTHSRSFAGSYGGENVFAVEKELHTRKDFLGVTDRDGYLRRTFWLRSYFGLQFEEQNGISMQRQADKMLRSGEEPKDPLLVYMG
jgi:hypothetical protein